MLPPLQVRGERGPCHEDGRAAAPLQPKGGAVAEAPQSGIFAAFQAAGWGAAPQEGGAVGMLHFGAGIIGIHDGGLVAVKVATVHAGGEVAAVHAGGEVAAVHAGGGVAAVHAD